MNAGDLLRPRDIRGMRSVRDETRLVRARRRRARTRSEAASRSGALTSRTLSRPRMAVAGPGWGRLG